MCFLNLYTPVILATLEAEAEGHPQSFNEFSVRQDPDTQTKKSVMKCVSI